MRPQAAFGAGVMLGATAITVLWLRLVSAPPVNQVRHPVCYRRGCHHYRNNHPLAEGCAIPGCTCPSFSATPVNDVPGPADTLSPNTPEPDWIKP